MLRARTVFFFFLAILFSRTIASGAEMADIKAQASKWLNSQSEKGFVENLGQMMDMNGVSVPFVLFKTEAPGLNFWITEKGIILQTLKMQKDEEKTAELHNEREYSQGENNDEKITISWERIDIELKGASINKNNIVAENPLEGHSNYFYPTCPNGIYEVKEYGKITINEVYPGVDWVFYRKADGTLKYDFIIHPGADYNQIELLYRSKTPIKINKEGELEQYTYYGNIKENTPISFYEGKEIETHFIQKFQKKISVNEDDGYETSVVFLLRNPDRLLLTSDLIIDPQLTWSTFYGHSGHEHAYSVDADQQGNIYLTGLVGSINFPTQALTTLGAFFQGVHGGSNWDTYILKFNNLGVRQWATFMGGSGDEWGFSVNTDNNGNVYTSGMTDSPNFPVSVGAFQATNAGSFDAYVVKFNNSGVMQWSTYYGGNDVDRGYSVAVNSLGNVFVTGYTRSTNFPVTPMGGAFTAPMFGNGDAFVLQLNASGTPQWSTYYGGTGGDISYAVAIDGSDNISITGNTVSPDFVTLNAFQATNSGEDAFIVKFNNIGVLQWSTYYGGAQSEWGYSITTDAAGNTYITGRTNSTNLPIYNLLGAYSQAANGGGFDAFILKLNGTGVPQWSTYYGGSGDEYFGGGSFDNLEVDKCGNLYVSLHTGSSNITTQSLSCSYNDNLLDGTTDQFILRFSKPGALEWATYFGGNDLDDVLSPIAVDITGNLFISGKWAAATSSGYSLVDPGGGAYYDSSPNGGNDIFVAKFIPPAYTLTTSSTNAGCICDGTASVNAVACALLHYTWYNTNTAWAVVGSGSTITGLCAGTYAVEAIDSSNCKTDTSFVTLTNSVIVKNTSQSATICFGGTFTLPSGGVVTTAGVYKDTLLTSLGCDSIITTNLSVINPFLNSNNISLCSGQSTLIHGVSRTTAGIYTQTYTAATGCDSISSITLVVNNATSYAISATACNAYTVNSQTYTTSGVYTQTLSNAKGCDSLLTINLTINPTVTTSDTQSICSGQSTLIHGVSRTTAGIYTQTYTAATGCDSISSITLVVNNATSYAISATACNAYTVNSQTYTTSGVYTQTLSNAKGCDSLLTINLTINPTATTSGTQSICSGQSTLIHGVSRTTAGIYTQTYTAATGCDSISSITLVVNNTTSNTISATACNAYTLNSQIYTTSGVYTQTLTNSVGCDSLLTINLNLLSVLYTNSNLSVCSGQAILIHGASYNISGIYTQTFVSIMGCDSISSVTLNVNGISSNTINPVSCNSYILNGQTYSASGIYTQTLANSYGCDSLLTISLTILPAINSNNTINICQGDSVLIHGQLQSTSGIYTQTFVGSNGCDSIPVVSLVVNPKPIAAFNTNPDKATMYNPTIFFTDQSANANSWRWNINDTLVFSTSPNPSFTFKDTGIYRVTLIVINEFGCLDSTLKEIYIYPESTIYFPNSFTPDGDGLNDLFLPGFFDLDSDKYELYIYDRWGMQIFKSTDINIGWNGTFKGGSEIAQQDTYVWIIKQKGETNKPSYAGHVNLVK